MTCICENLISILVTDYIQKRKEARLSSSLLNIICYQTDPRLKKNPESQMANVGIAHWSNRSVVVCISKSKKVWLAIRGTLPAYSFISQVL